MADYPVSSAGYMHLFCSAYIKQISFDSGNPDKTVQTEKGLVEWNVGRAYCMEDEEFMKLLEKVMSEVETYLEGGN